MSEIMFKQDPSNTGTETISVYAGATSAPLLDIYLGTEFSYVISSSNGYLPTGLCDGMGTFNEDTLYIGKTGSSHRDYYFSSYDTDDWNQAGYFCWNGIHCTDFGSTIYGDCNSPSGIHSDGYVEVFVRFDE